MVRFARADGSKGSNKRILEEPTPWSEMIAQRTTKTEQDSNEGSPKKKKLELVDGKDAAEAKKLKTEIKKTVLTEDKAVKGKKKKKVKEIISSDPKKEFVINSQGQRVKVFKDGTERTWFDLPYEDNERMTRYDGMWVKQEMVEKLDLLKESLRVEGLDAVVVMRKMMQAKRKAHRQLRIELIYEQKNLLREEKQVKKEHVSESPIKIKKKKKKNVPLTESPTSEKDRKNKKKVTLTESPIENNKKDKENTQNVALAESPIKTSKKDKKKVGVTEEESMKDDTHAVFDNEETMSEGDNFKGNSHLEFEQEGDSFKEDNLKGTDTLVFDCKENCIEGDNFKGSNQIVYEQENEKFHGDTFKGSNHLVFEHEEENLHRDTLKGNRCQIFDREENNFVGRNVNDNTHTVLDFEESDLMTQYEGYWVKREAVERLEAAKTEKLRSIREARVDGNDSEELTSAEQILFQRVMKKEKRFENKKLLREMAKLTGKRHLMTFGTYGQKSNAKKQSNATSADNEVVRFEGFWVKKESADRLNKLRDRLTSEGVSNEELKIIMQKERRKEERLLKNERKLVCLKCRQPGHMVSACPEASEQTGEGQITICYKCGSTEHTSRDCSLKPKGSEYSHATCYICGDVGHISRECPDNPRGLYPNGGACRGCGSVEHLVKDCPDLQKEQEKSTIKLSRIDGSAVEALDIEEADDPHVNAEVSPLKTNKVKVIQF
nr:uncharacterized protein LOC123758654 [Procambarus clarkii]